MAKRGIEKIRGFEDFPCLEVLWMQENDITSLNHLDNNFRLKSLYLSGNRISTLEGSSLKNLPNLEVLFLANNQITDLGIQLREVQQLPFLQQLELLGNPVAEETNYRQQVIHRIPSLKVLDRHVITSLERVLAAQMARHEGWDVKPEAPPPEDANLELLRAGQNIKMKMRGIHDVSRVPRIWRKRTCFGVMYEPPHARPVKFRPNLASKGEVDLHHRADGIYKLRKHRALEEEKEMYRGLGPPMAGNYQADLISAAQTPEQQAFGENLGHTRRSMRFESYPPWAPKGRVSSVDMPPKTARDPMKQKIGLSIQKPMTPPASTGQPQLTRTTNGWTQGTPPIELDKTLFGTFQARRSMKGSFRWANLVL